MTDKEHVLEMVRRLPDNVSVKQVAYHLYVLENVLQGLKESEHDLGSDHDEFAAELEERYAKEDAEMAAQS